MRGKFNKPLSRLALKRAGLEQASSKCADEQADLSSELEALRRSEAAGLAERERQRVELSRLHDSFKYCRRERSAGRREAARLRRTSGARKEWHEKRQQAEEVLAPLQASPRTCKTVRW